MAKKQIFKYNFTPGLNESAEQYPNALAVFRANLNFIVAEVSAYLAYNVANSVSPYVNYTYNDEKCKRDLSYVLEAVEEDLKFGANTATRQISTFYWKSDIPQVDGDRTPEYDVYANFVEDLVTTYICTNTTSTMLSGSPYQSEIAQTTTSSAAEAGGVSLLTDLFTIVGNVILTGTSLLDSGGIYTINAGVGRYTKITVKGYHPAKTLLLINNQTTGTLIYNFADSTKGAKTIYQQWPEDDTTITLEADTNTMAATDKLQIFVEADNTAIKPHITYQDPVEKMRVSNPQALMDTDFEYSLQATKWESVQLQNNIPGIFQRANEPAFQGSEIVSIIPAPSTGVSAAATAITSMTQQGRSGMLTTYSGNRDDGNYFISSPFSINFLGTNYTGMYVGTNGYISFGSGSSIYYSLQNVDFPNIPAIKFLPWDRRLYWLGRKTTGTAPNRSFWVRAEGNNFSTNSNAAWTCEFEFKEGETAVNIHYVNGPTSGFTPALQDGPGPSTTFLVTWGSGVMPDGSQYRVAWQENTAQTKLRVTVATAPTLPFSIGLPVILKETLDTLYLDGAFLIVNVASTTSFDIVTRSPVPYTGDQKTDYTAIYTGGFFSAAEMSISSITQVSGTTRAQINFTSNHGLFIGSKLYIVVDGTAEDVWIGAFTVNRVINNFTVQYNTDELVQFTANTTLGTSPTTRVYARNEGIAQHRYFDGGVQINPASNSPNSQIIRQTRKYFRYQSGKGIQFSTGVLFRPVYDIVVTEILTNTYDATTGTGYYLMTLTCDQEHGFTAASAYKQGARVRITGYTVTSGRNPYNGEFNVDQVIGKNIFSVIINVDAAVGGLPSDTSPGGIPRMEVIGWNDAVVRTGLFDDQNGLFFEHDGTYLYAVKRSSTQQIAGRINITQGSSTVTGTNTKFLSQLQEQDFIVIKGSSYLVTDIINDTSLTVSPDYRASTLANAKIVKTVDTRVRQTEFSLDPLDGTGPSGYLLDPNRMQMVFLDYSWYGAGKIRWGIRTTQGEIEYIHEEKQNNINTEAYMRSGNIPGRFEIQSKSKYGTVISQIGTTDTSCTVYEDEFELMPLSGTIIVNNEYIEYTKGSLSGNVRTLSLDTRNVGALTTLATHSAGVTWVSFNQNCSPSLSHWGVSAIMDGEFNSDKSYLFTAPTAGQVNCVSGATVPVVSVRLAPSVDYGIPGFYGVRNLVNRSALTLESIGLSTNGNFSIEVKLNSESTIFDTTTNWQKAPNGSIAQYMDHSQVTGTFTGGDTVAAFFGEEGSNKFSNSTYTIDSVRDLGNSILGGPGVYPDGPDILTVFVKNNSSTTRQVYGRITWTEAQG